MKIPVFKPFLVFGLAIILAGCSSTSPSIVSTPIENIDALPLKVSDLTDIQLKGWGGADLVNDTIPGMSVQKAYEEIIKNNKGQTVIVAVIDTGVDIEHEDLKSVVWFNRKEVPNNGKDDDNNGYVDDIHGWNFLGDSYKENMEYARIYKRFRSKYEGKSASQINQSDRAQYAEWQRAKAEYEKEYKETVQNQQQYQQIKTELVAAHRAVSTQLGKEDYTKAELAAMPANTEQMAQYKGMVTYMQNNIDENIPEALRILDESLEYFSNRLTSHFNLDLNARAVVGDDPYNINDRNYGNNQVMGPPGNKDNIEHGTHVSGIIAADRNNNIGIKGVANNVKIMAIRAVPDGDEYDKDIALAIRYAVDNGAKVINTSFGKYFSPNPEWVQEAIKYAAENDVLIVSGAGNEGINLDNTTVYPNDQLAGQTNEIAGNFLSVGALNYEYGSGLVAGFSNYGKTSVDVFAPGTKIWSTTPNNSYEFQQGTSMASPAVAGVAAIIRSFYPKLTAPQVKQIIIDSGLSTSASVLVGETGLNKRFSELSTSGKMVNLYNALILADKTKS